MYPHKFNYVRANSIEEALALLQAQPDGRLLAGGHSLIPLLKLRLAQPETLIDIGRIPDLNTMVADGKGWRVGALTTHSQLAANPYLPGALTDAASHIGDPQVRNRGTLGGNVAHADPASDLPTVLVCLDATFHIMGPGGKRTVSAEAFFTGFFETALDRGEILTHVEWLSWGAGSASAYAKLANPASRYAMVGAAAQLLVGEAGECLRARVAVGGLTAHAMRTASVEAALTGNILDDDALTAAAQAVDDDLGDDLLGDIHASAAYRRGVCPALVRRALATALGRARRA